MARLRFSIAASWCCAALLALASAPAGGALLVEEYFPYGDTELGSGYGDWSDGTQRVGYLPDNLPFANAAFVAPGNTDDTGSLALSAGAGSPRGVGLSFSDTALAGELWLSALVRMDASAGEGRRIVLTPNDESYSYGGPDDDQVGIGYDAAGKLAAIHRDQSAGTTAFGADALAAGDVYLLIAKMVIGAGDDALDLWLLGANDSFGATVASLGAPDISTAAGDWGDGVSNLWVGRVDESTYGRVDAIRLSDATGDTGVGEVVIPEPATVSLLLAGAGLLVRRTR